MLEIILIALATLGIALYLQARQAAREIRENRDRSPNEPMVFYRTER
jgi:hypothetical protein